MNNLLIVTTFKNNLVYQRPFYNFYSSVWKPSKILYYIGWVDDFQNNFDTTMDNLKIDPCTLKLEEYGDYHVFAKDVKMYSNDKIILVFYNTIRHHRNPGEWNNFREHLFKIHMKHLFSCKYYFSCDCDDFHYVSNPYEEIQKKQINFHNLEFIPMKKFNLDDDFEFISNHYFFRIKGGFKKQLSKDTSHHYCHSIFMNRPVSAPHVGYHADTCSQFDNEHSLQDVTLNSSSNICFSFGCLSKEQFISNGLFWDQSDKNNKMINQMDIEQLEHNFDENYTLTEKERDENIILVINNMKQYFH